MTTTQQDAHLILLFAKYPAEGTVKTRLHPRLGKEGATAFARAALIDHLHRFNAVGRLVWCFAPASAGSECRGLLEKEELAEQVGLWPQPDGVGLGERLKDALQRAKREAGIETISFVGADCLDLTPERLEASMRIAHEQRASVTLARDGGYVLLTLPASCAETIFDDIRWSTSTTGAEQIARIKSTGLEVVIEDDTLPDVDVPEDLDIFEHSKRRDRLEQTHPRTWAWLQTRVPPQDEPLPAVQP